MLLYIFILMESNCSCGKPSKHRNGVCDICFERERAEFAARRRDALRSDDVVKREINRSRRVSAHNSKKANPDKHHARMAIYHLKRLPKEEQDRVIEKCRKV
jgi:hypothetical protein